ncbi:recombinase family protein [Mechercharimyces sp. CAU 1602]|uniref:recombinase family protein n=1 Tax=Mechercharimyces sp. CAU 1602 TaxID=2973933 RepID=UPI002161A12A|nr:recombinase family protein [Mechercharimyces sp. CAU 1602]MCS1351191.1 recombinase family protein [Mechercharimyces sp. CAU 1602]
MNRPKNLDVFIYLRKSRTDEEEERKAIEEGNHFDTLDRHRKQLLDLARKEGHSIIEIFQEVVSGEYIIERPEIQRMLRQVESGAVEAILIVDLDRLGRGDMFDMGSIYRAVQHSDTLIVTPNEIIDPNDEGAELLFGVKSLISREELKSITKRMQRGRIASVNEGKSISKKPPYGYLRDNNHKLYPDPDTAWVVKKIFELCATGFGRLSILNELQNLGIPSPGNAPYWNVVTIKNILMNEAYLGHIVWGKTKFKKINGKTTSKKLPKEKWNIKENAHEPLIDQELWDKAHASYGLDSPRTKPGKTLKNPLAGVLYCRICGYSMHRKSDKNNCAMVRCLSPGCIGIQKSALLRLVETRILESVEQTITSYKLGAVETQEDDSSLSMKKAVIIKKEGEIKKLQNQKEKLHDLLEQGIYDVSTFLERQSKLTEKIKANSDHIKNLKDEVDLKTESQKKQKELIPKLQNITDRYEDTTDVEEKNKLLKSVIKKVLFSRTKRTKKDDFELEIFFHI